MQPQLAPTGSPPRGGDQLAHLGEHAVAEVGGDLDLEPVGQDPRPADHGRAIAAALADDRGRLARDREFINLGHTLDHLAVGRDDVARLDQDHVAGVQGLAGHGLVEPVLTAVVRHDQDFGRKVTLQRAQAA